MKTDYDAVLAGRNLTKRRCNVYYYEAMGSIARANGFTASEFFFGCGALAMKAAKRDVGFLNNRDILIMNKIRGWMSTCRTLFNILPA